MASVKYARDQAQGFTNRVKKIAIVGGGGHVGKYILAQIVETGNFEVTAITRPGSSSSSQLPAGVKTVAVDYSGDDLSVLVDALRGQQALIITMAVTAPRDTTSKLARAAAQASVPYIFPNWYGHDAGNDKLCQDSLLAPFRDAITAEIKSLGVSSYFLLVCNFWYEFSLGGGPDRFGFDFRKRTFIWFDKGDVAINTSTWPQCGRAIANLLSLKELPEDENDKSTTISQFANRPTYISSFLVSQKDMFDSVKRVTKTTDADWTISHESSEHRWKDGMAAVQQGNFAQFTKMLYSRMFFPTGDSDYESRRGIENKALSLPVEDLDEWTATAVAMGERGDVAYGH